MIERVIEFIKNNKVGVIVLILTLMVGATGLFLFSRIADKM